MTSFVDMDIASDRVSRGKRVQEIQKACGYGEGKTADNRGFTERLNAVARELGLGEEWKPERLSKVRSGTQDLSAEDMAVVAYLDPEKRGWTYVAFGIAVDQGADALDALAKNAAKNARRKRTG